MLIIDRGLGEKHWNGAGVIHGEGVSGYSHCFNAVNEHMDLFIRPQHLGMLYDDSSVCVCVCDSVYMCK